MNRAKILQDMQICRLCLTNDGELTNLYEQINPDLLPLPVQILSSTGIEVYPNDGMPQFICKLCCSYTLQGYTFKMNCKRAEDALKIFLAEGKLKKPVMKSFEIEEQLQGFSFFLEKNQSPEPQQSSPSISNEPVFETISCDLLEPQPQRNKIINPEMRFKHLEKDAQVTGPHKDESILGLDPLEGGEIEPQPKRIKVLNSEIMIRHDDLELQQHKNENVFEIQVTKTSILNSLLREKIPPKKLFVCCKCSDTFTYQSQLRTHFETAHPKPFSCALCTTSCKVFSTLEKLHLHQEQDHKQGSDTQFDCLSCRARFFSPEQRDDHQKKMLDYCKVMKYHQDDFYLKCNLCDIRFKDESLLTLHFDVIHRNQFCQFCNKKFDTKLNFNKHILSHSNKCKYNLNKHKMEFQHYVKLHLSQSPDNIDNNKGLILSKGMLPSLENTLNPIRCEENFELDSKDHINEIKVEEEEIPLLEEKPDPNTKPKFAENVSSTSGQIVTLQPLTPDENFTLKKLGLTADSVRAMVSNDFINLKVGDKMVKVKKVVIPRKKITLKDKPGPQKTSNGLGMPFTVAKPLENKTKKSYIRSQQKKCLDSNLINMEAIKRKAFNVFSNEIHEISD